jgi:lycopene beta-cyclase
MPHQGHPRGVEGGRDADLLIVGAGLSGLSLAYHLVEQGGLGGRRVLLLDPRRDYGRDRTWCFWNVVGHPFEDCVSHRWDAWRVRHRAGWVRRAHPGLAYQQVPSDRFYAKVRARLEAAPEVELRLGTSVTDLRQEGRDVVAETEDGPVRARLAFDSRPVPKRGRRTPDGEVVLLQHFEGWFVRTPEPAFDPGVATLMDFSVPQRHGIHFFYVLPYAADAALVEATWFGMERLTRDDYDAAIRAYLEEEIGVREWTVLDREAGVIPMSTEPIEQRPAERIYRIGLAGGLAKPSTGYAFLAVQQQSAAFAKRLLASPSECPDPPPPRPWRSAFQDRIFLSYLGRFPEQGPAVLTRLFEKVPPRLLARFLSDQASWAEGTGVMRQMPLVGMTREVVRSAPLWLRAQ